MPIPILLNYHKLMGEPLPNAGQSVANYIWHTANSIDVF